MLKSIGVQDEHGMAKSEVPGPCGPVKSIHRLSRGFEGR